MEQKKRESNPQMGLMENVALKHLNRDVSDKQKKHLGFLFCPANEAEIEEISNFIQQFQQAGIHLSVVIDFQAKRFPENFDFPDFYWLSRKDFSLWGTKKPALKQWLKERTFDLFVSFVKSPGKRCNQFIVAVQAVLKAGPVQASGRQLVDVSLAWEDQTGDYAQFYGQIEYYIEQLKIKISR
jgi:hypothetical protein